MTFQEELQMNKRVLEAVRKGLYGEDGSIDIVASHMTDGDNPRLDEYQIIKMLRVVMAQVYDISERLKKLEGDLDEKSDSISPYGNDIAKC